MANVDRTRRYVAQLVWPALALGALLGCDARGPAVRIDAPDHVDLLVGEHTTLDVEVVGGGATAASLTWTSDAPDVVAVAPDGTLTGVAAGAARVTVTPRAAPEAHHDVDVDVRSAAEHPGWFAAPDGRPAMRVAVHVRDTDDGRIAVVRNANAAPDAATFATPFPATSATEGAPRPATCPSRPADAEAARYLVRYAAPPTPATDVTAQGANLTRVRTITDTLHVVAAPAREGALRTTAARLAAAPGVVDATPDAIVTPAVGPTDPRADEQWGLRASGAAVAHDLLAVGAPLAPVPVAVIDGAVDLDHPDLAGVFLPGLDVCSAVEEGGCSGIDDDPGVDDEPVPATGHATHVAGILAANAGNDVGIAGVAPNARIVPIKIFHADAACRTRLSDLVTALRWAVDLPVDGLPSNPHPARIVNLSLSGGTTTDALQATIDAVRATGAIIIAAAGNDGRDLLPFPASADGVVAVGATTRIGLRASFSNARKSDAGGPGHLDLMAPGAGVLAPVVGGYGLMSGTSMAVPHVAGAAATLLGREPELGADAVLRRLQAATFFDPAIMTKETYGAGRLRMDALHGAPAPTTPATRTAEVVLDVGGERVRAPFDLMRGAARVPLDAVGPIDPSLVWNGATYR